MAVRDVVQAAAGQGGEEATYVEDVFSTYLYTGNGSTQTIENGIALGDGNYGPSVEFDGISDYLSRSSDMTGNADGKTFTFSCWVYALPTSEQKMLYSTDVTDNGFKIYIQSNNTLGIEAWNSSGTMVLQSVTSTQIPLYTWTSIIVSLDAANTSNRSVYINDVLASSTWYTYSNLVIDFTRTTHKIGFELAARYIKGRLSNVFLDYTYRDLSVEASRRLFITADGQPATGLASLSPILYMPLDGSTASVGTNSGTGGDFTVNGSPTVLTEGGPYTEAGYGQGGLVWLKDRLSASLGFHTIYDTEGGTGPDGGRIFAGTAGTNPRSTQADGLQSFDSTGFTLGANTYENGSGNSFASWTFRKAPKFFDVVTYTGDGANRTIAHNLGSVPGCIIVKRTDGSNPWAVYHRGSSPTVPEDKELQLNATDGAVNGFTTWNRTLPTDAVFSVGTEGKVNENGWQYVAYIFAHDAGGFGDDGEQNVISCGSLTTDGSGVSTVNLGYEPQWVLLKRSDGAGSWSLLDTMRGWDHSASKRLQANASDAEENYTFAGGSLGVPTATGFTTKGAVIDSNATYIYIAIRRPMKTPEAGTEVFAIDTAGGTAPNPPLYNAGFPVDMAIFALELSTSFDNRLHTRLLGETSLATNSTRTEAAATEGDFDYQDGWNSDVFTNATYISWMFKRAPGFMDVVAYTGTGSGTTFAHNLAVVPELMIFKTRSNAVGWAVSCGEVGYTNGGRLELNGQFGSEPNRVTGTPTTTTFSIGTDAYVNVSARTYIAYLFASLPGVSKVGSYSGTGADLNVDCGFSAGARFVLIKRTDSTGDWYVWDSARGIVSGNDPYLLLNSTAAEVTSTDYIDPLASGFTVTSSAPAALNASGGSYIFLAIA